MLQYHVYNIDFIWSNTYLTKIPELSKFPSKTSFILNRHTICTFRPVFKIKKFFVFNSNLMFEISSTVNIGLNLTMHYHINVVKISLLLYNIQNTIAYPLAGPPLGSWNVVVRVL